MSQQLLNPRGIFRLEENPIAPRLASLNNKIVGFIDNSKVNADMFLNRIQELLSKIYTFPEILRIRKSTGSVPASFPQEFFERCDFAINAFGD
ncbi:MAG: hypothetical protein JRG73_15620 [Deltaproteobacteria bacterium]|nr:hypothetical protein [Deltaproteobacteria bacterium]MBW2308354.1 hypothetical protein [Deltaproteobacteria bacterium]